MEVLALGFLILIGFTLFLEALHEEIPKGYIYFAVAFSLLIEFTNIRVKKKRDAKKKVVKLNKSYSQEEAKEVIIARVLWEEVRVQWLICNTHWEVSGTRGLFSGGNQSYIERIASPAFAPKECKPLT